ncbi:hypothetical protein HMPREF0645_0539 [Hallella bergensis DSM 17361]|uniref:Uncharacterized protein n=1 Tax=Hallella bergensis DSM 17361 TaxID=585502 RepID=D1PUA4_9BACT|nr:hypothetical protein HMPREF0645_0539 [Hallella bergensis DSM 17361]
MSVGRKTTVCRPIDVNKKLYARQQLTALMMCAIGTRGFICMVPFAGYTGKAYICMVKEGAKIYKIKIVLSFFQYSK